MSSLGDETSFDEAEGIQFTDYYKTVRGYVREQLVRQNLGSSLLQAPVKAIDVGGGEGRDAIWLARQGCTVTMVEPSKYMLARATARLAKEEPKVRKRVTFLQGNGESALKEYGPGQFDLVLSHGVLLYEMQNPKAHVARLFELTKASGLVSLVTKGWAGAKAELISEERLDELVKLHKTGKYTNHLGKQAIAHDDVQLAKYIADCGGIVQQWYGVRVMTDHMYQPVSEFSPRQLEEILLVEAWAGSKESTRGLGQMLHFIAKKK